MHVRQQDREQREQRELGRKNWTGDQDPQSRTTGEHQPHPGDECRGLKDGKRGGAVLDHVLEIDIRPVAQGGTQPGSLVDRALFSHRSAARRTALRR